jgi:hypothetical protein
MFNWDSSPVSLAQEWLVATGEGVLAPDAAQLSDTYELKVGDRPFARSLRTLFEFRGEPYPPELAALPGEVYAIVHGVGIFVRQGRANKIDAVGYRARFTAPGSTCELMPGSKFRSFASFKVNARMEVSLNADGYAKAPLNLPADAQVIPIGADAEVKLGGGASAVGNLSLSLNLKTPEIQAVGQSASEVIWQFNRADTPLVGDQVMVQTVVVPPKQTSLDFTIRAFATIDPSWRRRPVRVDREEVAVTVVLPVPQHG